MVSKKTPKTTPTENKEFAKSLIKNILKPKGFASSFTLSVDDDCAYFWIRGKEPVSIKFIDKSFKKKLQSFIINTGLVIPKEFL